ncbi:MAG TPA: hypothetical protein VMM76_16040 [Pirellulaceae bacterium]|nr:hypothetical protein [Pirellulaceae bacterium]
MAHELIRVYESGLAAPVLVDRLRSLSGHPLVVERLILASALARIGRDSSVHTVAFQPLAAKPSSK